MRKILVSISMVAGVLLVLTPVIPAIKVGTLGRENTVSSFEKITRMNREKLTEKLNGGFGLLELLIALLILLYVELGIIFNRSFTLILLLADLLYEIGVRLGLIDTTTLV